MLSGKLEEVFEDLAMRFIVNLPPEERSSFERIFIHIELAHWYYIDELQEKDSTLPDLKMQKFTEYMFEACPLLTPHKAHWREHLERFLEYKYSVPTYSAALISSDKKHMLLVSGIKSKSWSFPGGKMNQDETPAQCAAREVLEEVGYNISNQIKPQNYIEHQKNENQKKSGLFVVTNVPYNTKFHPQTQNEIGRIGWHEIPVVFAEMRSRQFYGVVPFARPLAAILKRLGISTTKSSPPDSGRHTPRSQTPQPRPAPSSIVARPNAQASASNDSISRLFASAKKDQQQKPSALTDLFAKAAASASSLPPTPAADAIVSPAPHQPQDQQHMYFPQAAHSPAALGTSPSAQYGVSPNNLYWTPTANMGATWHAGTASMVHPLAATGHVAPLPYSFPQPFMVHGHAAPQVAQPGQHVVYHPGMQQVVSPQPPQVAVHAPSPQPSMSSDQMLNLLLSGESS